MRNIVNEEYNNEFQFEKSQTTKQELLKLETTWLEAEKIKSWEGTPNQRKSQITLNQALSKFCV